MRDNDIKDVTGKFLADNVPDELPPGSSWLHFYAFPIA